MPPFLFVVVVVSRGYWSRTDVVVFVLEFGNLVNGQLLRTLFYVGNKLLINYNRFVIESSGIESNGQNVCGYDFCLGSSALC